MEAVFDYPVREHTYKTTKHRALKLYVLEPSHQISQCPVILFFFGGGFVRNNRTAAQFQHHANFFSSRGFTSICVDYRNANDTDFIPAQAIMDAKSAIRYIRKNSAEFGIDPAKIVMCGASSGGYTCVSSILFNELNEIDDETEISCIPNLLAVFAAGMDGVEIMNRLFPGIEEESQAISPIHHVKQGLPPTIWFCGTADPLYPQNLQFIEAMNQCGNQIDFYTYEGMEHGFFNYGLHDNKPYIETTKQMIKFFQDNL
ncbi:alpha/beta hydrolase [Paenibacillus sp. FSL M7-0420]|uniref:alpha/beta hydrolase n=1 Tax=Paenibacillus sp. FSL M7-0420 TaxID=2921609 RepID=UPI0030FB183D